jgi:hypothetical protein
MRQRTVGSEESTVIRIEPVLSKLIRCGALAVVALLAAPPAASAECVTVKVPPGERLRGPVAKPTLVFSGTVTGVDHELYTVSFAIDRVWTGTLRKGTTFFVAPAVEGASTYSFRPGTAYLVTSHNSVIVFGPADEASTGLPAGTVGVSFGCGDGPRPLSEARAELGRLSRGRAPLR